MAEIFKKVLRFNSLNDATVIKGVFKAVCCGNEVECSVTITSFISNANAVKIVVFDGNKIFTTNLIGGRNAYFKIVDFKGDNLTCFIFYNDVIVAFAKENNSLLPSEIESVLKTLNVTVSTTNLENFNYDDEAITNYNYYENESIIPNQNFNFNNQDRTKAQETFFEENVNGDETNANPFESDKILRNDRNVGEILKKYPINNELSSLLPNGKFVTINYDAENAYFVGETTFDGTKYTCVAVKGYYGGKRLENSFFIPVSILNAEGEGYFVSFKNLTQNNTVKNLLQ